MIRNRIFSPAIEQELDHVFHSLACILLDVCLAANTSIRFRDAGPPTAFDVSRSHKVRLMDLVSFSRIRAEYTASSFDDAFDC